MLGQPLLILGVGEINHVHPVVRHLVDGAIAVATHWSGSGLLLLFFVLSYYAVTWMMVPLGNAGDASSA